MSFNRRRYRLVLLGAAFVLGIYEGWSLFVRETAAVSIQGFHLKAADEFGQGIQVSQAFQMNANGLTAVDVQFSTDQPLTLLVRYEISEIRPPGTYEEIRDAIRTTSGSVTLKRVSGVEWRRISFSSMEGSDKRWFVIRLALIDAVPADEPRSMPSRAVPDRRFRVGVMISRDNVFGGGALWISDRRQLGSLSLRAFTYRRTAYQRFRADLAPTLPSILSNAAVELTILVGYQSALVIVVYALLVGCLNPSFSSRPPAAGSSRPRTEGRRSGTDSRQRSASTG